MQSHIIRLRFLVDDIFYVFGPKLLHKDNFVHDILSWYKIHTKFGHFKDIRYTKFNLRRKIESKIFVKPFFFISKTGGQDLISKTSAGGRLFFQVRSYLLIYFSLSISSAFVKNHVLLF